MPCHLSYDRLIHVAGLGHPGTFMMWDLEVKFKCWSFMAASAEAVPRTYGPWPRGL